MRPQLENGQFRAKNGGSPSDHHPIYCGWGTRLTPPVASARRFLRNLSPGRDRIVTCLFPSETGDDFVEPGSGCEGKFFRVVHLICATREMLPPESPSAGRSGHKKAGQRPAGLGNPGGIPRGNERRSALRGGLIPDAQNPRSAPSPPTCRHPTARSKTGRSESRSAWRQGYGNWPQAVKRVEWTPQAGFRRGTGWSTGPAAARPLGFADRGAPAPPAPPSRCPDTAQGGRRGGRHPGSGNEPAPGPGAG